LISPRRTRLVRVPDLRTARSAIRDLAGDSSSRGDGDETIVLVPTRAAASLVNGGIPLTRDELYDHLHKQVPDAPRRLTSSERHVIACASARAALEQTDMAIRLRAGLVVEILRFYDQLRRQGQHVDRFAELIDEALGPDDLDTGARRMRQQTRFLHAAFRDYQRRVGESDACDEHTLRDWLLAHPAEQPARHIVVTLADWIAEPDGLWIADFKLLSQLPGLESIDLIATEAVLGSGFHQRLHDWLPGLHEETRLRTGEAKPVLIVPPGSNDEAWWKHRDREEELIAVARTLKADRRSGSAAPLERVGIVFRSPLPYLYLASEVFSGAGIPYSVHDALPLAVEPVVASIDLVLDVVAANFTRDTIVALLRSPHLTFASDDGDPVSRSAVSRLDRYLSDARYLGDPAQLQLLIDRVPIEARPALNRAIAIALELEVLCSPAPASTHLRCLLAFWQAHLSPGIGGGRFAPRESRARQAMIDLLGDLASVHELHDDPDWTVADLSLAIRHAIEEHTFDTVDARDGVRLLDDRAARYGDFDDVTIVGLVESEWPRRPMRNIFFPASLLKALGWPSERDRHAAEDAHFLDLLCLASRRTALSTFVLDEEALVSRSIQLDEIPRAGLPALRAASAAPASRVFFDEALSLEPVSFEPLDASARRWAELRLSRTSPSSSAYHGDVPPGAARPWSVSALETYLGCPFRFFAQHVLKLKEEPDDEEIMDPKRQGEFVHDVFEQFFDTWSGLGKSAISPANLDEARDVFEAVVDEALQRLSATEAGLERTRLLGSPAAAGLGEAVMRMEAERPVPVVKRFVEYELQGDFRFVTAGGTRSVALKGKADRIDLLADGTFRLIDYKLGWPPDRRIALQLPLYGLCAEQQLARNEGRSWTLGEAAYIAFKGPRRIVPLFRNEAERDETLAAAQTRLVETVDRIAAGRFPPTPDDVYRCETCAYATVCRKDYVGDV
jgi:RecB family exonuclease